MSDLDPRHVEAVAGTLAPKPMSYYSGTDAYRSYMLRAERLLTSTDPDVHAALLAVLVRADYLSRARELAEVAAELATASGCSPQDALKVMVQALTEVVSHAHE